MSGTPQPTSQWQERYPLMTGPVAEPYLSLRPGDLVTRNGVHCRVATVSMRTDRMEFWLVPE